MIKLIHGNRDGDADLDMMFRGRRRVFVDRLKWPLTVDPRGREIDAFDSLDPLYMLAMAANGALVGSMRLMPTTGPTLLNGPFCEAFDEPVDIRSAAIWDVTRFCVHPEAREVTPTGMNRTTAELCQGLAEVALRVGLSHLIAIYDDRMMRVYMRIGWWPERLATNLPSWTETVHVGL